MGGPTAGSYRASEEARQRRLAARRTRDGVVDLAEWRHAWRAARGLRVLLCDPPWLLDARVAVTRPVGLEIVMRVTRADRDVLVCIPSSMDDVPVRVVAASRGRAGPAGEA